MPSGPISLHLRGALRRRWRALLAIALLFGLTAGVAVAALASARRTQSAYPRLLDATQASDISVDFGAPDPAVNASLASLPGVEASSTWVAFNAAPVDADGHVVETTFEAVASLDGRHFDQDRVIVVQGRMPDRTRADEVAISEPTIARDHINLGDQLDLALISDELLFSGADPATLTPEGHQPVTVVGVIVFTDEVIQDDNDVISRVLMTPAFTAEHQQLATYAWQGLRVRPGIDVDDLTNAVRAVADPVAEKNGGFVLIRRLSEDQSRVDRAILPQVSALLIAALLVAIVALVLVVQAAVRQIRASEPELIVYRSIGMAPRRVGLTAAAPVLVAVALGAVIAVGVAVAASPLSPLGSLRRVEYDPGFDLDAAAVLGGVAALSMLGAIGVLLAGSASARRIRRPLQTSRSIRPSRVGSWLQAAGAPVSIATGASEALQHETGPRSTSLRSLTVGTVVAIAALATALCFGASLDHLTNQPNLYGWNWDAAVIDQAGYGSIDPGRAHAALDTDPEVEGWALMGVASTAIDGTTVPLLGLDPDATVAPPVLSGRAIAGDDEIALGRSTMRRLGKQVGDTVSFGPDHRSLTIVGTASLPAIGQVHSSHPSPGEGGIVTFRNIATSGGDTTDDSEPGTSDEAPPLPASVVVIRLRPGADVDSAMTRLRESTTALGEIPGSAEMLDVSRPAEIINADSIGVAPTLMAGVLTAAALISLSLGMVGGVRRRRGDLAALKAIGFTRNQVTTMILTQSLIVTTIGVAIGAPLGVVAGRWLWSRFADRLSVVAEPTVPYRILVLVIVGLAIGGLIVAIAPSRIASRIRAGDVLHRR